MRVFTINRCISIAFATQFKRQSGFGKAGDARNAVIFFTGKKEEIHQDCER